MELLRGDRGDTKAAEEISISTDIPLIQPVIEPTGKSSTLEGSHSRMRLLGRLC